MSSCLVKEDQNSPDHKDNADNRDDGTHRHQQLRAERSLHDLNRRITRRLPAVLALACREGCKRHGQRQEHDPLASGGKLLPQLRLRLHPPVSEDHLAELPQRQRHARGGPKPQKMYPAGCEASSPMAPPWSAFGAFPKASWMAMAPIKTCRIPLTVKPVLAATTKAREFEASSTASAASFMSFLMAVPFLRLHACDRPVPTTSTAQPEGIIPGILGLASRGTVNCRPAHGGSRRPTGMRQATWSAASPRRKSAFPSPTTF